MKPRKIIVQDSTGRRIIEQGRIRLWCAGLFFLLCFTSIGWRMIDVAVIGTKHEMTITVTDPDTNEASEEVTSQSSEPVLQRGDIVDRNGTLLATSLMTASLFANPKEISNPQDTAEKLEKTLGVDGKKLLVNLKSGKSFLWIKRNLTPREEQAANSLGIPGLYFQPEERRVYPYGNLFSHTVGYVGLDNKGLAGVEKRFDDRLRDEDQNREPLTLSLDVRLQAIMREEMKKAVDEFHAAGATGIIMDLHSGELLSMVSLPDFDPNHPGKADDNSRFNRASLGVYEMGSTFKSFTMAMALNYGTATMKSSYDTTGPLHIGGFTVHDDEPKNRWLNVPEIYAYSSNVGAARMALDVGIKRQKTFLEKLGLMKPVDIELPEKGTPLYPSDWKEINSVTIAYGHGMSVSPLHLVRGIAALVDGGTLPRLTLLKDGNKDRVISERVISEQTSKNIRRLMRLVVDHGTGSKANVPGYRVAGKTGTAEKVSGGVYEKNAKLTSFIATFPVDNPQYIVLVMVDNPKGDESTHRFATGGWISAPVVSRVISRMGPIYGIEPQFDVPEDDAEKFWVDNKETPSKPASHPASLPPELKNISMPPFIDLIRAVPETLEYKPDAEPLSISGIASDSRQVKPGYLFAALKGAQSDGTKFIGQAKQSGAVAILCGRSTEVAEPGIAVVKASDPRFALAHMAAAFYGTQPKHIAAVTGTDGKTSTADFFRQFWHHMGKAAASIGTLGVIAELRPMPDIKKQMSENALTSDIRHLASVTSATTPDPVQLHKLLAELHENKIEHVAMEASSHGLHQYRLDGVKLEAAAFTNITRDHLDYHHTEEAYFAAKLRLFSELLPEGETAVLNEDDEKFGQIKVVCARRKHKIIGFGKSGSQLKVIRIEPLPHGQRAGLQLFDKSCLLDIPLVGAFQVMNILAALGLVIGTGGKLDKALAVIPKLTGVPGRLEQVAQLTNGATVFIDYAHTPMALANILNTLRPHTKKKLHVLFGCGGDRDKGKRPEMGKIAGKLADAVIVTDDNPRSEVPAEIRKAILDAAVNAKEVADRREAIYAALKALNTGDILVIAGKGHEKTQTIGNKVLPFDDAEVVREAVKELKLAA